MSDLEGALLPDTVAVTLPENLTIHDVMSFIRDAARNLYDIDIILKKHKLTKKQYELIQSNKFFQNAFNDAVKEWNSPLSTEKRIAMEAAAALEDALPKVAARMHSTAEPLAAVVETAKLFAKMAGIGEEKTQGHSGEKFSIVINLGSDEKLRYDPPTDISVEVQPLIEGKIADKAV